MNQATRILVPINGTDEALDALPLAEKLARTLDAELMFLLVTYFDEDTDEPTYYTGWLPKGLTESVSHYSRAIFSKINTIIPSDIHQSYHRRSGQARNEILKFAKENNVNYIVMGCRKLSFLSTILNGSVSRHILENSECPVTIVK